MLNCIGHSFGAMMRVTCRSYVFVGAIFSVLAGARFAQAQSLPAAGSSESTCAALLADDPRPATTPSARGATDSLPQRDTASASIGGARTGAPDIILTAAVQANEVRFASQPRVRVRLCWAGDTLTVVQRDNIPSPVVAGTTYRNVFVAVELLGRLNAECLVDRISGSRNPVNRARPDSATNLGACAFLGASAATGRQPSTSPRP